MVITGTKGKGGTGNTRKMLAVCSYLASKGKRVWYIDLDPQCDGTKTLTPEDLREDIQDPLNTVWITLRLSESVPVYETNINNLFYTPSHESLYFDVEEILKEEDCYFRLKNSVDKVKDKFDYVFIDTPAFLGAGLTQWAYIASDYVEIVVTPGENELDGIDRVTRLMEVTNKKYESNTNILSCVLNKANISRYTSDGDPVWDRATKETILRLSGHSYVSNFFCKTYLRFSPSEASAGFDNQDSWSYDPNSMFSQGIASYVKEVFKV